MDLPPVDALTKMVLLGFGALIALAGLWLIFRPPGEGGKTIIHLLGLKFEAASAGILVFVVGIGVVTLSLFLHALPASNQATALSRVTGVERTPADPPQNGNQQGWLTQAEPQPISLDGTEVEGNNSTASANIIQVGTSVVGKISRDDPVDVFRIDTKDYAGATLYVTLTADNSAGLQVLQPTGKALYRQKVGYGGSLTFEGPVEFESYVARVAEGHGGPGSSYELLVTAR
ncbi:hypothetical protein KHP62_01505 [Rhodobacteraceae bacterium NNCM2]|nr:hypothetical protein [Coraliihabitans acroporae]